MSRGKVLVAMSGGVDSSVAAWLLLQQGYECLGATMRLATNEDEQPGERTCCSIDDVADAREAAWKLGIRHYVFDYTRQFDRDVIAPFVACYEAGGTPNPCVACNRLLKFGALLDRALELGCTHVATGHYARIEAAAECPDRLRLLKGIDARKDQSYFLFGLTQPRLAHVLLPLGGLEKEGQVRRIAEEAGLAVARKRDSEGICFVPEGDHQRFIEQYRGRVCEPGNVLDTAGNVLGHHQGALRYTIGQRKGLGIALGKPSYVCAIDAAANTVTLGDEADLLRRGLVADEWNWIAGEPPSTNSFAAKAKIRYRQREQPCTVQTIDGMRVRIIFDEPQRAIAPGQAVVVYRGDEVLGGGTILEAF